MGEKVVAIVEARMGSSRLPGKSMKPLAGTPLVGHVLGRAQRARTVDQVVLATSTSPKDDPLAEYVAGAGFTVHRGSEEDVLGRILGAARASGATVHVQCWGDCPFLDPDQIDAVVEQLRASGADLVSNCIGEDRKTPYGLDVIALTVAALERAELATRGDAYHREHGTTYLYQTKGAFRVERVDVPDDIALPKLDLTINTEEDYRFVDAVYAALLPSKPDFRIRDVLTFLRAHPELINEKNRAALAAGTQ